MRSPGLLFLCVAGATVLSRKERSSLGPDRPYFPCGVKNDDVFPRIGNGQEPKPYSIPWQVFVRIRKGYKSDRCGGTIIGPYHIITAAHCVYNVRESDVTVTVAEHNVRHNHHEIRHSVSCIITHPGYERESKQKDFAILILENRIEFNDKAAAACLPIDNLYETYEGKILTVSGWGQYNRRKASDVLLYTYVKGISNHDCKKYNGLRDVSNFKLCAKSLDGKIGNACPGDSGGPLTYDDNYKVTLVGVVSAGPGERCGTPGKVATYARITSVMDWILDSGVYENKKPTCSYFLIDEYWWIRDILYYLS